MTNRDSNEPNELDRRAIFVGGCSRSGTTMLGDHLGRLPGVVVTPESQFKIRAMEVFSTKGVHAAIEYVRSQFRFKLWDLDLNDESLHDASTPGEFLLKIVDQYARKVGKPDWHVWVDHSPGNIEHWSVLSNAFNTARFIHLIRDGRAIAASIIPLDWGPNNVIRAAEWWCERISPGLALAQRADVSVSQFRYEELVRSDALLWNQVADACGMEFRKELMEGGGFQVSDYSQSQHKLVGGGVNKSRIDAWKRTLSAREIELFEFVAAGLLAALNYELVHTYHRPPSRYESLRMGEWPVKVRWRVFRKARYFIRKRMA